MLFTVNVALAFLLEIFPVDTAHCPRLFVVQVPVPDDPPDHVPVTLALASRLWFSSCTVIVTVAAQLLRRTVAPEPSRSPTCAVGGGGGAVTVTFCDCVPVAPPLSVTVSVTLYVPAAAYVWFVFTPLPVELSPK